MRREKLGGLDAVLAGGSDREGGGDGPVVVLCHGFGAPGDDLVPLWRYLDVPPEVRFVFPAAPLALDGYGGRAWWMIDLERIQRAQLDGGADLARGKPAGLDEARDALMSLVDAVETRLAPPRLALGGFSQGAMLAWDVALHRTKTPAAVAMLSGTLVAEDEWTRLLPARRGMPLFLSHGTHDPLLPYALSERLRAIAEGAALPVEWVPFRGGHEIPPAVLDQLGPFLTRALTK